MSIENNPFTFIDDNFPLETVTTAVGCILAQVCAANEKLLLTRIPPKSRFQATNRPQISIQGYVSRISKYSQCNAQSFILALIYIDRLIQRNPSFLITSLNAHRLFITAIVAAAKFSSDFFFKNSFYAKVGGISTPELNELELEFLFRTHFDLFVKKDTFCQYHQHLMMYSTNGTRIPRPLLVKETAESTKPKIETVCVPERCKAQQYSRPRVQENARDVDINCGGISVPYNLRSNGQNRSRCRQPFSRYQFPQAQNSHHQASFHPSHRRHKSDQNHFHGNHPYAKRHRSTDRNNISVTSEANLGKSVSVSMDIWFPMPSATTVAAR